MSFLNWFLGRNETENSASESSTPPTDYGYGFEARQLINGKWVLWHKGKACDLVTAGYSWDPGTRYWKDCMGSWSQVDSSAKEIMAAHGIFKSTK